MRKVLALVVVFCLANLGFAQEDYDAAVKRAEAENKPLMVIIGASWCPSCQVLKKETIEQMKKDGELDEIILVYVDKDNKPTLAEQLMRGNTLPQTIGFKKDSDGWKRYSLSGLLSKLRVRELLSRIRGK